MGTTLHGVIECFIPAGEWARAHWESFAEIEFNKDYPLQIALSELDRDGARNWFRLWGTQRAKFESSTTTEQIAKADVGHDAGWVMLEELEAIAAKLEHDEDGDSRSAQLLGTIAFMRAMSKSWPKTRLIYWHM